MLDWGDAFAAGPDAYLAAAAHIAQELPSDADLVVHSGAGALVPAILATAGSSVRSVVFVDALLPHPGRSWFDTVPPDMASRLRAAATEGRLPPWTDWLPASAFAALIPNGKMRRALAASVPRVPLAFLEQPAPHSALTADARCAYLQLSDAYEADARAARALGWPVRRLDGDHLSIMTRPGPVADALVALVDSIAGRGRVTGVRRPSGS